MRIIKKSHEVADFLKRLATRGSGVDPSIGKTVAGILDDVRAHGDDAVLRHTRIFDGYDARSLRLTSSEIAKSAEGAETGVLKALSISARRIRKFHEMQIEESWSFAGKETVLGQSIRPLSRVGVYVPGGKAAYPSTVLMNVIPAQVAGVREVAVCVPSPSGRINPYVMAAIKMLGITEVYRIGGAQAVAALAYGTKSIKKVDKIVGPGNIYVATAKRMVFGLCDIDMIAGPSEILIIADDSADPSFIASDLLSQAEHDELASSVVITDSPVLAAGIATEVEKQLSLLSRREIASASLENYGAIIISSDIPAAVGLSNLIAPEHLEIMTEKPMEVLPLIENAGAIFLGPWTPEALGDYSAGPNHTLPTGGTSRFFSPLGVYDFYKRSSVIGFTKKGFMRISRTVERLADIEGLEAHGNSIRTRRKKVEKSKEKFQEKKS